MNYLCLNELISYVDLLDFLKTWPACCNWSVIDAKKGARCENLKYYLETWGPFPEGPEKFSGPESHNKNLKPYVYRADLLTQF